MANLSIYREMNDVLGIYLFLDMLPTQVRRWLIYQNIKYVVRNNFVLSNGASK